VFKNTVENATGKINPSWGDLELRTMSFLVIEFASDF